MDMYSYLYLSKALLTSLSLLLFAIGHIGCMGTGNTYTGDGEVYVILPGDYDSKKDLKWSKYLYDHMKRRGGDDDAPVLYDVNVENCKFVTVHVDNNAKGDFIIIIIVKEYILLPRMTTLCCGSYISICVRLRILTNVFRSMTFRPV